MPLFIYRHVWLRSKAVKGGCCIGATDDPSSWDSPLELNSTDRWSNNRGAGSSYVPPWEIIFELVRVSRADRVTLSPLLRSLLATDATSTAVFPAGGQSLCN